MNRPLHPNLARIAAAYDEVMESYRRGQIAGSEARRRVLALVARDDNGLEWSINPDTGRWQYRSHFGDLCEAEPPTYGVAGFTPNDLGAGRGDDSRVHLIEVDQEALHAPGALAGSTLLTGTSRSGVRQRRRFRWALLLAGAGGAVGAAAMFLR